jgi:hypothetical protein
MQTPHVYGTQRALLACFLFVPPLSSWCLTRSPKTLASLVVRIPPTTWRLKEVGDHQSNLRNHELLVRYNALYTPSESPLQYILPTAYARAGRPPSIDQGLEGVGAVPHSAGRHPSRGRHPMVQEVRHRPDMIRNAGRHRRRPLHTVRRPETGMRRTEVVHRPNQIHPAMHRLRSADLPARAPTGDRQPAAKCPIQAFDERRVEHLGVLNVALQCPLKHWKPEHVLWTSSSTPRCRRWLP